MIDEDRTMQLFGYTSDELSKGSHKKIVAVCEECGIYRCVRKREYSDLCFTCSRTGENHYMWAGGDVNKICEVCGKEFSTTTWEANKGWGRFCSHGCQSKWQSEARSGENGPGWKEKIVKICEVCGKEFSVTPAKSHRKFCSCECYGKWCSKNLAGENSPCFGKIRPYDIRKRVSATLQCISYDEWESFAEDHPYCPKFNNACRESNREKYDRRCFLSGMTEAENGKRLSVHHIDMDKNQGCDGHAWKLVPLAANWHGMAHTPTWVARIQYLLTHVWGAP